MNENIVYQLMATIGLDSTEYETGLKNAGLMAESSGGMISSALKGALALGVSAVGAATTAVVAFGKEAVETGKGFDSSMSQVAATMGKTMDELNADVGTTETSFGEFTGTLRDFAQYMGSNTAFSASQAADALNYMALAGYDAQKSMDMLPKVLDLAAAGGIELATASDMVTDAQSALGLTLEETSAMVDQMAKASSKSNTSVGQLGEAFLTVGGTAKDLKGGTVELATTLGILADNGVKGAEGGTALRNIIMSLGSPTDQAAAALQNMGIAVYDAEGNMRSMNDVFGELNGALGTMTTEERTNVLGNIFNKVDLKSANALLANTTSAFYDLAYQEMDLGRITDDLGINVSVADYAMENLGASAADIHDVMTETGNKTDFVAEMMERFGAQSYEAEEIWDALSGTIDGSTNRFDELSASIEDATGAAAQMAATQLGNLAGDITLFQSALEGAYIAVSDQLTPALRGFVQFGTNSISELTQAFNDGGIDAVFEKLPDVIQEAVESISKAIPKAVEMGGKLITSVAKGISAAMPSIMDSIGGLIDLLISFLSENTPVMIEQGAQFVRSLGSGFASAFPEFLANALPLLLSFSGSLRENVGTIVDAGIDMIMSLVDGLIAGLPSLIAYAPQIISNLVGIINDNAPKLLFAGAELIIKLGLGLIQSIPAIIANMGNIVKAIIDVITAINWISIGSQIVTALGNGIAALIGNPVETIRGMIDSIKGLFEGFSWSDLGSWAINMLDKGIEALFNSPVQLIQSIVATISTFITGFHWSELGEHAINTIASGIRSLLSVPFNLIQELARNISSFMTSFDWRGLGLNMLNMIANGISSLLGVPLQHITNLASNIARFVTGFDWMSLGRHIINMIANAMSSILHMPLDLITRLSESIRSFIVGFNWHGLGTFLLNGIVSGISSLLGIPLNLLQGLIGNISNAFHGFNWWEIGSNLLGRITDGIRSLIGSPVDTLRGMVNNAAGVFRSFDWWSIGRNVIDGVVDGIRNAGGAIKDTLMGFARNAFNSVKSFFDINSPSRRMRNEIGKFLPPGVAVGVEDTADVAIDAMSSMAKSMTKAFVDSYETPEIDPVEINGKSRLSTSLQASARPIEDAFGNQPSKTDPYRIIDRTGNWPKTAPSYPANNSITVNVYAAEGMDVKAVADEVMEQMNRELQKKEEVFA